MATVLPGAVATAPNPANSISNIVAQMSASGNPQAAQLAAQLTSQYGVSGTGKQAQSNLSLMDQVKNAAGVAANYALPVLNVLNRPSQAVLHTLQGFSGQGANILNPNVVGNALQSGAQAFVGQQPDINLRQAVLGNDQGNNTLGLDKGGLAAGLIDTVGGGAMDPTTYFGGPAAKAGLKGLSVAGKAAIGTDAATAIADKLSPITDKLAALKAAVVPGASLEQALGSDAGKVVQPAIQNAAEDTLQQTGDVSNQLNSLIKTSGVSDDELKNVINPAIAANHTAPLIASYVAQGNQPAADLVSKLGSILSDNAATSAQRIPFQLSKDGLSALKSDPQALADSLGVGLKDLNKAVDSGVAPSLPNPTPYVPKTTSLGDYESKLAQSGVLKEGKQYLNHDIANLATKAAQNTAETANKAKLLTNTLADVVDNKGQKIVLGADQAKEAAKRDFVSTDIGNGTKVFVHPAVAQAMHDVATTINQDKFVESFDNVMTRANRWWKGMAVLTPHFHTQNVFGNMFMNTIAGLRDPRWYATSARIEKIMAGLSSSTKGFEQALKDANISYADRKAIQEIRNEHIADSSFSHAILNNPRTLKGDTGLAGAATDAAKKLNPLNSNNIALMANRTIGGAIENNSRIAHFLWALSKNGGDAKAARESVAKYLFDYNDLTPLERKRLQPLIPFYTYMRKNTPAQMKLLLEHPGAYANYGKFEQNMQQHGPDNGTQYNPQDLANGAFPINLLGVGTVLANPSSPLFSAFNQLQPLGDAAALIPGSPTANNVANPRQNLASNLLSPVGGLTGGLAKFAAEEATGKNLYTGGNIKPGTNLSLLAGTVMPTFNLGNGIYKAAQQGNTAGLLNKIGGIPISQSGQATTNSTLAGRLADVQAALATLQGQVGKANIPTVTALRKSGRMPKAASIHRRRAKTAHKPHRKLA